MKRIRRSIITVGVLLLFWRCALALDPALDVSQYAHTAWRSQEGFARGEIISIAQTPDGYLWLGTLLGLFRFDGVRTVAWRPPQGQPLPDSHIRCLLGARDATLWIGSSAGLASWKGNRLTLYPQLKGWAINALLEDRQGIVWASAQSTTSSFAMLCTITRDGVRCEGDDGRLGQWVTSLHESDNGDLWVEAATGLWRWRPGAPKLQWAGSPLSSGLQDIADDEAGGVLIVTQAGIKRFVGEETAVPFAAFPDVHPGRLLRDHNGSLWIGTVGSGLLHVHDGRTDAFGMSDGLSSESVNRIFEDREGNIWVATTGGLERFHDVAAATYSAPQGLSNPSVASVLASRDGSIWISTLDGLNHWSGDEKTRYTSLQESISRQPLPQAGQASAVHQIVVGGLPSGGASLFEDRQGRLWIASHAGVGYLENNRYVAIEGIAGGHMDAITQDVTGNLWIAHDTLGLIRISRDLKVQTYSWQQLRLQSAISRLVADQTGGLWLGLRAGSIAHFVDGRVRATYSAADGLANGRIYALRMDPAGTLWVGAEGGLSRIKSERIATLDSSRGLPCDPVDWMIDDDTGAIWIDTECGLARTTRSDLDSWASAVDKGEARGLRIHATVIDESDGVRSEFTFSTFSPHVAKSRDGRLWFATLSGVGMVDPGHLPHNALRPAVHIEDVIADRKNYETSATLRLPPLARDLQFNYTALSLVAPEKNQFRYKLEGHDRDWQSVGNRRQAFYNDLPPGSYQFRVVASNNSGVWNEEGATLDFSIAPAYWQTTWFRAACAVVFLIVLWALYQLRLRQIRQGFNARLEERVAERTRIARELHDTLLQNFQGLLLRFQTVLALCETRPAEAKEVLRGSIDETAQAITEGREAVQGLRDSTVESNDLARAITTLGEEIAAEATSQPSVGLHVEVEGTPRNLHPIVRDEIYRIVGEVLRNAFQHAEAKQIEVELRYDERQLRLRVRDDGKGIDPKFLTAEGRAGHFGLLGMRERAKLVRGKLTVWSAPDSGTEIELSVPAAHAYVASPRRSWFAGKFSGKDSEKEA